MAHNLYWDDIHSHAFCGRAFSDPESDLAIAQSHLDFWAPTEHAIGQKFNEELFPEYWPRLRKLLIESNRPGKFATIPGWEWADCTDWCAGDMNVYFPDDATEQMPVPRRYAEMIDFVRERRAILIPHHVGYQPPYPGTDWDRFVPEVMPAVEIFSMHGSSEREDARSRGRPLLWRSCASPNGACYRSEGHRPGTRRRHVPRKPQRGRTVARRR